MTLTDGMRPNRRSSSVPCLVFTAAFLVVLWWLGGGVPRPGWLSASAGGSPRVLVFGANGWIGGQILDTLKTHGIPSVKAISQPGKEPDSKVEDELEAVRPTHVISVLGRTHGPGVATIDYLEGGPDKLLLNLRDNLYAPLTLARLCERRGVHFTYFGTGCIFKYEGDHRPDGTPKTEQDAPNFFGSSYSVAKGFTDRLFHQYEGSALNLRIRMPFNDDDHPRNFITKIAKYPRVINIPNSISYLPDLLDVMVDLMLQRRTGTLNLVSPGVVSHKEVLDLYREVVNATHTVTIVEPEEQRRSLAADRSNTYLSTAKLERWAPTVLPVKEALRRAMQGIRRSKELKGEL